MSSLLWALAAGGWGSSLVLALRIAACREAAARAAHEVRGPLGAAMLALHGLEGPADRRAALGAQLERAGRALDDLAGRPADRFEPLAAAALLASVAEAWRPVAAAQGRRLLVAPAAGGLMVHGDRIRLAQAVGNLIANALEHGAGPVQVRPRVRGGRLRIEVSDTGAGLPAPVDVLVRRPRAGRGMRGRGLAIAAAIAVRHGGRLSGAPAEQGAVLVLELPLAASQVREAAEP